jgi:hypothetical protein
MGLKAGRHGSESRFTAYVEALSSAPAVLNAIESRSLLQGRVSRRGESELQQ